MTRENYSSGTSWESKVGYARAVRSDGIIYVSGTTATDDDGQLVGVGDAYAQTIQTLKNVETALQQLGGSIEDVVRTRMYVTDISDWEEVGRAHGEYFESVRPATSMIEVSRLIHPDMLIEIEATADIN